MFIEWLIQTKTYCNIKQEIGYNMYTIKNIHDSLNLIFKIYIFFQIILEIIKNLKIKT